LTGHEERVTKLAFSPDGGRLVSQSRVNSMRVWNAESGECLEVIEGSGDIFAIAAGASRFPFRAVARRLETVIERTDTTQGVCWFPVSLGTIITRPSGRSWALLALGDLYLLTLEGDDTLRAGNQPQPPPAT
jgi:WD40 repeat protein